MKQTLTAITFCIALSSLDAQHLKEKLFAETVTKVIEAFATQDSIALARLTDSKTGVLQYAALPKWNCDGEKWSKTGVFADTLIDDYMFTDGCRLKNKYEPGSYSEETIN